MNPPTAWTGREAKALRAALRLSVRGYAAYLGVSPRTVTNWESGAASFVPRPDSQAILDTVLARAAPEVQAIFSRLLEDSPVGEPVRKSAAGTQFGLDGKEAIAVAVPDEAKGLSRILLVDATPVTRGEYRHFVVDAAHPQPPDWDASDGLEDKSDHPVTHVSHVDASIYAHWAGKRLPTAEEWQAVAAGPESTTFPWGDQQTPTKCNVLESRIRQTTHVRRFHSGVSADGVYDLAGNVWEWCSTGTAPGRYALKGSAFTSPLIMAAAAAVNDADAAMFDDDTGFRCVRDIV